jgi:CRP-like cAMP-binding protein
MLASTNALRIDDFDLFADCSRAQLQQIGSLTTYLRIPGGHVLIHEGDIAKEFIVILRGTAEVSRHTAHGRVHVADVGTGDLLGEMALLSGSRRTATVTATTDLEVLVSSVGEFRSLVELAPSVGHKIRRASASRASSQGIAA